MRTQRVERYTNLNQGIPHIEWRVWNREHTHYNSFHARSKARSFLKHQKQQDEARDDLRRMENH
jgi:hypothetical protein